MHKYLALLRGVNVGGKNKVSMPLLKAAFEQAGFFDVVTYINSGNLIFSCAKRDTVILQQEISAIIKTTFGLDIAVAVLSASDLVQAMNHAPEWWNSDSDSKHNVLYVISPADAASVCKAVGDPKPEYEQISGFGQVIFWSAPLKTFSRTRWSKISSLSVYRDITIRNANTALMLLQLVE